MMITLLKRSAALLLIAVMMISMVGCAAVTERLDGFFKEETTTADDSLQSEPEIEMPARTKENYTILIMTEAEEEAKLDNAMLISFNTASPSISILQLPTDLYLNVSELTVEGLFKKRYDDSIADGHTEEEAAADASEAVADVLSDGFYTPVDYYINFSSAQLAGLINTLGGVKMNLPFAIGNLAMGTQTLSGSEALEFLAFDSYTDMPESYMDARKLLTAAIFERATEAVEADMLSLFVMELRSTMTTNIPSSGGEDIFFVRKWLQTDPTDLQIASLSTQAVYIASASCRVLLKGNTLTQMNELLGLYEEELTLEQLDPQRVFVDYSSDVSKAVYNSSAELPKTYTARQLLDGSLILSK